MGIYDIFSRRQGRENAPQPDVYRYDEIPKPLRAQFVHIIRDVLGDGTRNETTKHLFESIARILCREYGLLELPTARPRSSDEVDVLNFVLQADTADEVLDVVEMALRLGRTAGRGLDPYASKPTMTADDAIAEVNHRLQEHAIGYRFDGKQMIRIDSEYVHAEAVRPALRLLQGDGFSGAEDEFQRAHEHYRHGRYKEALNESLKTLESTLKTICARQGWKHSETATASVLIDTVFREGLLPKFLQTEFAALRATLEAGVPTTRNRMGGHGQGAAPVAVPGYIAAYVLHLTAASILLLVEAEKPL